MNAAAADGLVGRRVLLVEDEWLIASDQVAALEAHGVEVIGPAGTVENALALVAQTPRIDGALLDLNLRGEMAFLVADALLARGVPIVFVTGYDSIAVPKRYAGLPRWEKPVSPLKVVQALFG